MRLEGQLYQASLKLKPECCRELAAGQRVCRRQKRHPGEWQRRGPRFRRSTDKGQLAESERRTRFSGRGRAGRGEWLEVAAEVN